MFSPGGASAAAVALDAAALDDAVRGRVAGRSAAGSTAAERRRLEDLLEDRAPDPAVASMARAIAGRLARRRRASRTRSDTGAGPLAPVPFRHRSDDIDLDRTLDVLVERPRPEARDIVVRERVAERRTVVLIVDVSGSMKGEKVRVAAATVGALAADLRSSEDRLAVVAFWSDAAVVAPLAPARAPTELVDTLLRVPAKGLTNVGFGLAAGLSELVRSTARNRSAVLLTDAVHNAGPDPRHIARRFPRLHVLLQTDGEHDQPLGRDLARLGHGRCATIGHHRDVAPALDRLATR